MIKIKNSIIVLFIFSMILTIEAGAEAEPEPLSMKITVDNETDYDIIIDDLETLNIWGGLLAGGKDQAKARRVFHDVGPFPAHKKTTDGLGDGNWAPGVGNQTEAHVIIVKKEDNTRSDYNQGKITVKDNYNNFSNPIEFDNRYFYIKVVAGEAQKDESLGGFLWVYFYTIIVTEHHQKLNF